jgi:hypothetical protein
MAQWLYLTSICLILGTVLAIFAIRAFAQVQQAKARLANDGAYQQIAEKAAAVQTENTAALNAIRASLSDVTARLAAVEKMLKEVG